MKRLAALIVLTAALLVGVPAVAHADEPVCYSMPNLPGECLTQPVYAQLVALTNQNALMADHIEKQEAFADQEHIRSNTQLALAYDEIENLTQRVEELTDRVMVLRAKVKMLRALV
jgi:hypothetical protein